jgi:hypothetical protein
MPQPHSLKSIAGWRTTTLFTRTPGWAIAHRENTSMLNPNPPRVRSDRVNSSGNEWSLEDLLGRSMGRITEDPPKHFTIHPDGQAWTRWLTSSRALSSMKAHTRGVSRRDGFRKLGPGCGPRCGPARTDFVSNNSAGPALPKRPRRQGAPRGRDEGA